MPIYEYYCPDNHRIYQFYAKTMAQGQLIPRCPDNPAYRMEKIVSRFAINATGRKPDDGPPIGDKMPGSPDDGGPEDARMEAAMSAMEREFSSVDENDPRAMGRMMRRMAELTGEKIDGEMEEVVRKLEEGVDPDKLEEQLGGGEGDGGAEDPYGMGEGGPGAAGEGAPESKEPGTNRPRFRTRKGEPVRDPTLYDYE